MSESAALRDFNQAGANIPLSQVLDQAESGFTQQILNFPLNFSFKWNELTTIIKVDDEDDRTFMQVVVDLGMIPYSGENAARRQYLKNLSHTKLPLKDCWFTAVDGNRLKFGGTINLESPKTGIDIVSAVVRFLIPAQPYLLLALAETPAIGGED